MIRKFDTALKQRNKSSINFEGTFVYKENNKILGFLIANHFYDNHNRIVCIFVNKKYRRRGVANKLRQYFFNEYGHANIYTIINPKYLDYYLKLGLEMCDDRFRSDYGIVMVKKPN